jgi:16S rRNA G966 N2-methylase RsmD
MFKILKRENSFWQKNNPKLLHIYAGGVIGLERSMKNAKKTYLMDKEVYEEFMKQLYI